MLLRSLEHYVKDSPRVPDKKCCPALQAFLDASRLLHTQLFKDEGWADEPLIRIANTYVSSGEVLMVTLSSFQAVDGEVIAMYQRMVLQVQVLFKRLMASLGVG